MLAGQCPQYAREPSTSDVTVHEVGTSLSSRGSLIVPPPLDERLLHLSVSKHKYVMSTDYPDSPIEGSRTD
jgi:hypothetical protein